jgi:outer membrane lipoprotein-sorting protein
MRLSSRLLPPVVAGVVVAGIAVGVSAAGSAAPTPPAKSTTEILALAAGSQIPGVSGTVVVKAGLGLPAVPSSDRAGRSAEGLLGLATGNHTLRVWSAGPGKWRVQLLGQLDETDAVRNGTDAWTYAYSSNSATHYLLPNTQHEQAPSSPFIMTTPQGAAQRLMATLGPTTEVSTGPSLTVAGRSAYQLEIVPRTADSLIGLASVAIDAKTGLPLRVAITARGTSSPALVIGFTSVSIGTQSPAQFTFTPPPGAKVTTKDLRGAASQAGSAGSGSVVGSGWTSVVVIPSGALPPGIEGLLAKQATPVSGGMLVHTALLNALIANDGRIFVGVVTPTVLESAANAH